MFISGVEQESWNILVETIYPLDTWNISNSKSLYDILSRIFCKMYKIKIFQVSSGYMKLDTWNFLSSTSEIFDIWNFLDKACRFSEFLQCVKWNFSWNYSNFSWLAINLMDQSLEFRSLFVHFRHHFSEETSKKFIINRIFELPKRCSRTFCIHILQNHISSRLIWFWSFPLFGEHFGVVMKVTKRKRFLFLKFSLLSEQGLLWSFPISVYEFLKFTVFTL